MFSVFYLSIGKNMEEVYLIHSNSSLARSLVLVLVVLFHLVVALRSATREPLRVDSIWFLWSKKRCFLCDPQESSGKHGNVAGSTGHDTIKSPLNHQWTHLRMTFEDLDGFNKKKNWRVFLDGCFNDGPPTIHDRQVQQLALCAFIFDPTYFTRTCLLFFLLIRTSNKSETVIKLTTSTTHLPRFLGSWSDFTSGDRHSKALWLEEFHQCDILTGKMVRVFWTYFYYEFLGGVAYFRRRLCRNNMKKRIATGEKAPGSYHTWQCVKTLVPLVNPKIAGIYGCSSH